LFWNRELKERYVEAKKEFEEVKSLIQEEEKEMGGLCDARSFAYDDIIIQGFNQSEKNTTFSFYHVYLFFLL